MARNIEIKAHVANLDEIALRAAGFATEGPTEIIQDDTFFDCSLGRLKLRAFGPDRGELIFYRRENQAGPKESFYVRSPTDSPDTLRETLSLAYGQVGRIRKHRILYIAGRTRIHLDRVDDLGHFLELEVVLGDGESVERGVAEAHALMERLGVHDSQLIEGAYLDLLNARAATATPRAVAGRLE
jgi:predicted adenylyl cyclase CyaB